MAASNRGIVRSDLNGRGSIRTEIQHTSSFVGTGADDLGSVLGKALMVSFAKTYVKMRVQRPEPTGDQQQFKTGASCSKSAFPSLWPCSLIS